MKACPPQVLLNVTTRQNKTSFHVGEVIPLKLAFTSSIPNTFQLDAASYDRSGRMNEEKFVVNPAIGWDDPLASISDRTVAS